VAVKTKDIAVVVDAPLQHWSHRREGVGVGLALEAKTQKRFCDLVNLIRFGLDHEVDDPFTGQTRNSCASDVLDKRFGTRIRYERSNALGDGGGPCVVLVRADSADGRTSPPAGNRRAYKAEA
jgi:hypothetical protein